MIQRDVGSGIYRVTCQGETVLVSIEHYTDQVRIVRETQKRHMEFIFIRPVAKEYLSQGRVQVETTQRYRRPRGKAVSPTGGVHHFTTVSENGIECSLNSPKN